MRVLMISDFYPPIIGGLERHVQTLSRELVRRGHRIAVATLWHEGSPAFEDDEGVSVHRLTGWNHMLARFYEDPERQYHLPLPDPGVMHGLRRVVEQERPDIVHARGWMLYSFLGIKAWSKAKLVVTLHDHSLVCATKVYLNDGHVCTGPSYAKCVRCVSSQLGGMKGILLPSGLRLSSHLHHHVDRFIAISRAVRDASLVGTGHPPQPIDVVPTFIPDNVLSEAHDAGRPAFLPPTDDYILFVGRQAPQKGLDVLLEAFAGLSDLAPLVVIVAEEGMLRQYPAGVTVVPNAPHAQVMAAWNHSAVGVVPSILAEAFGQVALEAMACSKPVVASAVGGLPEVVLDGETGLLVPPGDVNALREAIRTLLLAPAVRARMGAAGRERARMFTVGAVANQIEHIYAEVLGQTSVPASSTARSTVRHDMP